MAAWSQLSISEIIKQHPGQLSIATIARAITADAEIERAVMIELSKDYMAGQLTARLIGDQLLTLFQVSFEWEGGLVIDGKHYQAGAFFTYPNEGGYLVNERARVIQSPYISNFEVTRADFARYLTGKPPLPSDSPLIDWLSHRKLEPQQQAKPKGVYAERDNDFLNWLETDKPDLDALKKADIHAILTKRNARLWSSGFTDWWKQQNIYKAKQGRKSDLNR